MGIWIIIFFFLQIKISVRYLSLHTTILRSTGSCISLRFCLKEMHKTVHFFLLLPQKKKKQFEFEFTEFRFEFSEFKFSEFTEFDLMNSEI